MLAGYKYRARILDVSSDRRKSYEINRITVAETIDGSKMCGKDVCISRPRTEEFELSRGFEQ